MKYFELATQPDTDAYFAQFTDDATVEDEGQERHGIAEIRAWRTEVPRVRYDVKSIERDDRIADASVEISGDFPGSPATLAFHFEYAEDGQIKVLRIRG
jgi:hypothetical protein